MHPPGNENATRQGGALKTDDADKLAHPSPMGKVLNELWPANVAALDRVGAKFSWRRGRADIVAMCPICDGRLILDDAKPFFHCFGPLSCHLDRKSFAHVVALLGEAAT